MKCYCYSKNALLIAAILLVASGTSCATDDTEIQDPELDIPELNTDTPTESNTSVPTDTDTALIPTDTDTALIPTDTDSDVDTNNQWGFSFTPPKKRTLVCDEKGPAGEDTLPIFDRHFLCTLGESDEEGVIYVEAVPTKCHSAMWFTVSWSIGTAQGYSAGTLSPLTDISFAEVEPHSASELTFVYNNQKHVYFHSSFALGLYAYHAMDCEKLFSTDGILLENGCTCDRTRPITCVRQNEDGTFPELVDTFEQSEDDCL